MTVQVCEQPGGGPSSWVNAGDGPDGLCTTHTCDSGASGPTCRAAECMPGTKQCRDPHTIETCTDNHVWSTLLCAAVPGLTPPVSCVQGTCLDACTAADQQQSYAGCEYWGGAQDNPLDRMWRGQTASGQGVADSDFAFVVANTTTISATVKVYRMIAGREVLAKTTTVAGMNDATRGLAVIKLPWQSLGTSDPHQPNPDVAVTGIAPYAYHLLSNRPLTVYQFNPLANGRWTSQACNPMGFGIECTDQVDWQYQRTCDPPPGDPTPRCHYYTYSNDASLLLPAHSLGTSHMVIAPDHLARVHDVGETPYQDFGSHIYVIATHDNTMVQVQSTAVTTAGMMIPALGQGATYSFMLNKYDVLQLETDNLGANYTSCVHDPYFLGSGGTAADGAPFMCHVANDLTGSVVTSDQPIAVFGGSACNIVPFSHAACDHLEEQIFPSPTWGKRFIAQQMHSYRYGDGTFAPPDKMAADKYKIVAGCPSMTCPQGTLIHLSTTPTVGGVITSHCSSGSLLTNDCRLLGGQWVEFESKANFVVDADGPIAVAQFESGEDATISEDPTQPFNLSFHAAEGDPDMILLPPVEQWKGNYTLLSAPGFKDNYLGIVIDMSNTSGVKVDGVQVSNLSQIPGTNYFAANVSVSNGTHLVQAMTGTSTVGPYAGVIVYGYDQYCSYGYTGGLDLHPINPIKPK
jgi:hypothetical protein